MQEGSKRKSVALAPRCRMRSMTAAGLRCKIRVRVEAVRLPDRRALRPRSLAATESEESIMKSRILVFLVMAAVSASGAAPAHGGGGWGGGGSWGGGGGGGHGGGGGAWHGGGGGWHGGHGGHSHGSVFIAGGFWPGWWWGWP